jgi:hypothetical protein
MFLKSCFDSESPEGAQRIPGCDVVNEQSRNARWFFQATLMVFFVCLFVSGCATRSDKSISITDDCEQTCNAINAARKHALKHDHAFFSSNYLYSVTNTGNVWEVRFHAKAPPGMVVLGGAVTFFIDSKTFAVINELAEQ